LGDLGKSAIELAYAVQRDWTLLWIGSKSSVISSGTLRSPLCWAICTRRHFAAQRPDTRQTEGTKVHANVISIESAADAFIALGPADWMPRNELGFELDPFLALFLVTVND
jgi:hypothetical protein